MTKKTTAPSPSTELSPFDGKPVVRTSLAVTNAGDGLSAAMSVEPRELHLGERVVLVLDCEVTKVRFEGDSKDRPDVLNRVHVLRAGTATFIDPALVQEALEAQALKIEAARGVERLPFPNADDLDDLEAGTVIDITSGNAVG